jgi:hypothetical protein
MVAVNKEASLWLILNHHFDLVNRYLISVLQKDHRFVLFVVITITTFHHVWLITITTFHHVWLITITTFHHVWLITITTFHHVCLITITTFHHVWLIPGFLVRVTRTVSVVEQELLILFCRSTLVYFQFFSEVRVAQFSVVFCQLLFVFFVFLVIVLSVRRMAASDNPFGIFKLFSSNSNLFSTCYNWNVAWNNIQVLL